VILSAQQRLAIGARSQADERTDVHADQSKRSVGLLEEPLKVPYLRAAGRAQASPEVEDHRLPLLLPQI